MGHDRAIARSLSPIPAVFPATLSLSIFFQKRLQSTERAGQGLERVGVGDGGGNAYLFLAPDQQKRGLRLVS